MCRSFKLYIEGIMYAKTTFTQLSSNGLSQSNAKLVKIITTCHGQN